MGPGSRFRRNLVRRVIAYILTFAGVYVVACFVLARSYLQPAREIPVRPKGIDEVQIPWKGHASDPAWCSPNLAKGQPSQVVFIFANGYGGTRDTWSDIMPELEQRGIESVAPAMPGQDASPQPQVGFGIKEAATMARTAAWVRSQFPKVKIVYAGVSMGGAAAWLASEIDPSAAGVVSEGAYARFDEAMSNWFERKARGASVYLRPVVWIASAMTGIKPENVLPVRAAGKWKGKPALVIQGGDDTLIVRSHADRLCRASGADLWIVLGAAHADCYRDDKKDYLDRLEAFSKQL